MTTNDSHPMTTGTIRVQRMPRWFTGRSELFVVAGVLILATWMLIGTVTMEVPDGAAFPGPQFFPTLVCVFLYAVGIALAIEVLRTPQRQHVGDDPVEISDEMLRDLGSIDATSEIRVVSPEDYAATPTDAAGSAASGSDHRTVLITIAGFAGFIVILPFVGWLISAAALFWVIAWAFGSKRPLMDIAIAVIISSVVQLAFGAGLGLSLPAGFLGGIL
ncbi:tripartite tricarboxylate transporter TctB family protein [Microbacterium hatanonis]|uniref:Tripartite tricarboxylate transporter TctB family protein n=2 Tax=Microbacterium hatanonis TaxID=404366 RepID=A0A5C8I429_9MICO|nr:tripartite tricarboxylate transporter TctB family protein [Microbacterium hatanonis]